MYNSNKPGKKTTTPRVNTTPNSMETPSLGTPLLVGIREAGGPHPLGERKFSKFSSHEYPIFEHGSSSTIFAWRSLIKKYFVYQYLVEVGTGVGAVVMYFL